MLCNIRAKGSGMAGQEQRRRNKEAEGDPGGKAGAGEKALVLKTTISGSYFGSQPCKQKWVQF